MFIYVFQKPENKTIDLYIAQWVTVPEKVTYILLGIATCQLRKTRGMVALSHEAWLQM